MVRVLFFMPGRFLNTKKANSAMTLQINWTKEASDQQAARY